jgi:glycosyltransferase involved in cell wall biosynthesis
MQKKKVLYLITKGNWGGAQRYVFDLASSLPSEKYDAVVACGEGEELPRKLLAKNIRVARISLLARDVGFLRDIKNLWKIYKLIKSEKPDILHLNSSKAAFLGSLVSRLLSLAPKIIFTVHGWPFREQRSRIQKFGIFLLSWLTALLSNKIITVCKSDFETAQKMLLISKKTELIHNGIAPFALEKRKNKDITIITIAELTKNKGIVYALNAIKMLCEDSASSIGLPRFRYIILGDGEERANLEKIINENKLGNIVQLAGFVEGAPAQLSNADIFLLSSLKEGLPYVLLEAGIAGAPVIASAVGGIPDIIDDMKNGVLIRPKREKEIADAIRFLLINHKKREEFGSALREKTLRDFSFKKMLSATLAVYEN